jgi:glycine dehydrogenase
LERALFSPSDTFVSRHIGPRDADVEQMLAALGFASLDALIDATVPAAIRRREPLALGPARGEHELLRELHDLARQNRVHRSLIGAGYYGCITPPVIARNVLENPGWYTQYTPYQAEIAQGRLEALLNFQTMVGDLTGLPLANASMLDEATAAAEAMTMCWRIAGGERPRFVVAADCHPQTLAVLATRAEPLGIDLVVAAPEAMDVGAGNVCGVLLQVPATDGRVVDPRPVIARAKVAGVLVVMATDLLALTLLVPPGELGADIAVGSSQRFGVPLGGGGPHAAFLATTEEHRRQVPGRIIGVSKDAAGRPAYRLALQTREQHIRRDRATSNICTAQVLLAIMASMYAVHHGPAGLLRIARRVHGWAVVLAEGLRRLGYRLAGRTFFDTLRVEVGGAAADTLFAAAAERRLNLRRYPDGALGIAVDETTSARDVGDLLEVFAGGKPRSFDLADLMAAAEPAVPPDLRRTSGFLSHPVFHSYHSEHELLRYLHRLQHKDLSLTTSMIALGSCTMKLNGTSEMVPVTWPEIAHIHPFAPSDQTAGYREIYRRLEAWLAEITGFAAVSLQPNAGAQGEYAGLLVLRARQRDRGQAHRDVCLIPTSAHGTNPASAALAGLRVVPIACDKSGNVDMADLRAKAAAHRAELCALMVTYPSTHGVFESGIRDLCAVVHEAGGYVYLDGANLNAQVGLCRPGDYGADVCHLNLHKTFCIPHGGGGPGMGPIAVSAELAPYLPGHPMAPGAGDRPKACGAVSAAPYGSPSILPISYVYIALMGGAGLERATSIAILNANYMAARLGGHYEVLFKGPSGRVAHEFVLDCRPFKKSAGIEIDDIAKRLMDFGFHAPTMSWPVAGTLMIEPTESESLAEIERFCAAMIAIRDEIRAVEEGRLPRDDNPLKHAPHTAAAVAATTWDHPYSREQAAFPAPWLRNHKYWPPVGRIDNTYGDRNFVCSCPPMAAFADPG